MAVTRIANLSRDLIPEGTLDHPEKEPLLRIKTIMVLRILFLTGFVVLVMAFERNSLHETPIAPLSIVIGIAYFLSMTYALLMRIGFMPTALAWFQVLGDLFVVGGLIYTTGGIESPLSFLFLLVIIATSVMLPRAACYFSASCASIIYGLLVDLEYFNVIQPVYFFHKSSVSYQGAYGFYIIALNVASYYSVAFLSSILTHRLRLIREELTHKSQDLAKLQHFHRNVIQNMGSGLFTTDLSGRITSVNAACQTVTGYPLDECLGQLCFKLFPLDELKSFFQEGRTGLLPRHIEGECQRKDGETIRVSMKLSRLMKPESDIDPGQEATEGFICVFEDLTEMRRLEEKMLQSEQLAAVGKFSAGLAHEIRNPLASLSGSIQMLRNGLELKGEYQHLMDIVIKETQRLNSIVSDFLSYSQPRKNKATVIDLTQLLEDIVILMKNSNEYDPAIQIELDVPPDHIIIQSEEAQIRQMVWNLCINGVQAMNRAGKLVMKLAKVNGYAHPQFETERRGVLLVVEDQGRGIPQDKLEKIFDPFFTTREEGIGLGLATVKQIVHRFGGQIGVESAPEKGTRFTIFLPQERALLGHRHPPEVVESEPNTTKS